MHACGIDKKALSQGAKAYAETLKDDIMTATSKDTLDGGYLELLAHSHYVLDGSHERVCMHTELWLCL